jgi:DNA mismatch repair protein MutH
MERAEAIEKLKELTGQNLHDLALLHKVTVTASNGKANKGWAGHALERYLGLPLNSAQSPNFGSWELKSFPLKILKDGRIVAKETMAITMIDPVNVMAKPFSESHLLSKLKKMVCVARIVDSNYLLPSQIVDVITFDVEHDQDMLNVIQMDYEAVRKALLENDGNITCLSGKMGKYIQPRTKGAGHGSVSRAFYARTSFLNQLMITNK